MKSFKLICEIGNFANDSTDNSLSSNCYHIRKAVRAVLKDDNNNIALLNVVKDKYFKLPGGGIEKGESIHKALERELLEETGVKAKILAKIGIVIEYREGDNYDHGLIQISYCFDASVVKEVSKPTYTASENDSQMSLIWVPIKKAYNLIKSSRTKGGQNFIIKRDLAILKSSSFYD